jgi:hypothetical protein
MNELYDYFQLRKNQESLENQFIYPIPKRSKFIFFAPLGVGVNEEPTTRSGGARRSQNQLALLRNPR